MLEFNTRKACMYILILQSQHRELQLSLCTYVSPTCQLHMEPIAWRHWQTWWYLLLKVCRAQGMHALEAAKSVMGVLRLLLKLSVYLCAGSAAGGRGSDAGELPLLCCISRCVVPSCL